MRSVVLLEHMSLDGYLCGPDDEMDWITADDEIFDFGDPIVASADTVIWGRKTYEMMAAYWPNAADSPDASRHDISHARWVNAASRLVYSTTLKSAPWGAGGQCELVRTLDPDQIGRLKAQPGGDIIIIGSPSIARGFIGHGLVDHYWVNLNPVVLGRGKKLFPDDAGMREFKLVESHRFASGVLGLHYQKR